MPVPSRRLVPFVLVAAATVLCRCSATVLQETVDSGAADASTVSDAGACPSVVNAGQPCATSGVSCPGYLNCAGIATAVSVLTCDNGTWLVAGPSPCADGGVTDSGSKDSKADSEASDGARDSAESETDSTTTHHDSSAEAEADSRAESGGDSSLDADATLDAMRDTGNGDAKGDVGILDTSAPGDAEVGDAGGGPACSSCPPAVCGVVDGGSECIDQATCTSRCPNPDGAGCIIRWEPDPGCAPGLGCCEGDIVPPPIIMPSTNGPFFNDFSATILMPGLPCAALCYTVDQSQPLCTPSSVPSAGACGECVHGQLYDPTTGVPVGTNPTFVNAVSCYAGITQSTTASQVFNLQVAAPTMSQPAPGNLGAVTQGVTVSGAPCGAVNPNANPPCYAAAPTISTATNPSAAPSALWIAYTIAPAPQPTCTSGTIIDLQTPPLANRIGISATTTIQAIACKTGYAPSEVATFEYEVGPSSDAGP
jgi:hypothetical protein